MVPLWELLHSAEPYAKTIEYAVIFATLIAAIYATHKVRSGAKEIRMGAKEIKDLETRLFDLSSRTRQAATESAEELEDSVSKFGHGTGQMLQNMQGQLANLVEGERGQLLQTSQAMRSPQIENQEGQGEPPTASQQREPSSSGDAYDCHQQWWQQIVDMKFDDPEHVEQPLDEQHPHAIALARHLADRVAQRPSGWRVRRRVLRSGQEDQRIMAQAAQGCR